MISDDGLMGKGDEPLGVNRRSYVMAGFMGLLNVPFAILMLGITGTFPKIFPYASDSDAEMAAWFVDNQGRTLLQIATSNITIVLLVWFTWGLLRYLDVQTGSLIEWLTMSGAIMVAVIYMIANAMWISIAWHFCQSPADWPVMRALFETSILVLFVAGFPNAATVGAFAFAASRTTHARSPWLVGSSYLVAAACAAWPFGALVTSGWLVPYSIPSILPYILHLVWVSMFSVILLRGRARNE